MKEEKVQSVSKKASSVELEQAGPLVGYSSGIRYKIRGEFLFTGISLAGARVLEIGCGRGAWAIWAALNGAERVVGIEPEAQGSKSNTLAIFKRNIELLGLKDKVMATDQNLRQFLLQKQVFDVVIMYNVINHIDEASVVALHRNPAAFEQYIEIVRNLLLWITSDGWLIVGDSSRENFWDKVGLRSPLSPTIEWHKHQNPDTWINVFESAGYQLFDLRWSPLQPFPTVTANRLVQYFTCSHFILRLRPAARLAIEQGIN